MTANMFAARRGWHRSVTPDRIADACRRHQTSLDNPGICVRCGANAEGVEPDARAYKCEICGKPGVFGAEELAIMTF